MNEDSTSEEKIEEYEILLPIQLEALNQNPTLLGKCITLGFIINYSMRLRELYHQKIINEKDGE